MNRENRMSAFKGYMIMIAGIAIVVALSTVIDVQISLARINTRDPSTWPDIGPQIRYFFIPVFSAALAICSVIVNLLLQLVSRRYFTSWSHWGLLGASFGLVSLMFPAFRLGVSLPGAASIFIVSSLVCAVWVRVYFGASDT